MTTLSGRAPKDSYKELLKLNTTNAGVSGTLVGVVDGEGGATPLSLSSTSIAFYGKVMPEAPAQAGLVLTSKADGTLEWAVSTGGGAGGAAPYDVAGAIVGKPMSNGNVLVYMVPRAFTFPAGLAGSVGHAMTTATSGVILSVRKNGVEFGTITFDIGASAGVFASAAGATFAAGDMLSVVTPSTIDATFADAYFTLAGTAA